MMMKNCRLQERESVKDMKFYQRGFIRLSAIVNCRMMNYSKYVKNGGSSMNLFMIKQSSRLTGAAQDCIVTAQLF